MGFFLYTFSFELILYITMITGTYSCTVHTILQELKNIVHCRSYYDTFTGTLSFTFK